MKKFVFLIPIFLFLQSCSSQTYLDSATIENLIKSREFTFVAERAIPNAEATNLVYSLSLPNANQILQLGPGTDIVFKKEEVESYLPYFGRNFNGSRDLDDIGIKFTSKDFTIKEEQGKKGKIILTFDPKDVSRVNAIYLEISPSGKAYVSVNSNDRQPISYSGYISKNEEKKK